MDSRKARLVLFVAAVGLLYAQSANIGSLYKVILVVLYFILLGALIERGFLSRRYWPFQRHIGLLDLAISAACLTAALASALGIAVFRGHRDAMLGFGILMLGFLVGGLVFMTKGFLYGPRL